MGLTLLLYAIIQSRNFSKEPAAANAPLATSAEDAPHSIVVCGEMNESFKVGSKLSDQESGARKPTTSKRTRLSKDIWLKHTLGKIGEVGVAGVQIESMAKELGVTKGSFYWHFQDRDSLLSEALAYWYDSATKAIGRVGKRDFENPVDRLRYFYTLALNRKPDVPGGPIERALHQWGRVSEIAAETTRRVDQDRIGLIAEAYVELGKSEHQARQTAKMALANIVGLNILSRFDGKPCDAEDAKAFLALFLGEMLDHEPRQAGFARTTTDTAPSLR